MTSVDQLVLLPHPRQIRPLAGQITRAQLAAGQPAVRAQIRPDLPAQGYRLRLTPERITLQAAGGAGAFYGQMTLRQLARQGTDTLPCCEIEDFPDFPSRGVMLDISRDKVPTLATLFALVDQLAEWKINHLEFYTEHTFAYRHHRVVWQDASPLTAEEVRQLDAYCRERFVELVPNQNSFGHCERWLKHSAYKHLAECPDGFRRPWGGCSTQGTVLCPTDPAALNLLRELYAELLPNFSSKKFNVGCDETWELGQGRSQAACDRVGKGRVYLEFLLQIHQLVQQQGRTMHCWGDIILQHPDLVAELPPDVVVLEWGYEANHPFDEHGAVFARSGRPFHVCPGTSSWNTIAGRTENCLGNLRNAAVSGLQHGARGFLNTDWGDNGHWQYLPVSYLGFAAGAAYSWRVSSGGHSERNNEFLNRHGDARSPHPRAQDDTTWLVRALDLHVFRDPANVMGRVAADLGNAYRVAEFPIPNQSVLFSLLHHDFSAPVFEAVDKKKLAATRAFIEETLQLLARAHMQRADAELIRAEFTNAARMLSHACDRALGRDKRALAEELRAIIAEHRRLWLARNRPGGLADSARRLEARLEDYGDS